MSPPAVMTRTGSVPDATRLPSMATVPEALRSADSEVGVSASAGGDGTCGAAGAATLASNTMPPVETRWSWAPGAACPDIDAASPPVRDIVVAPSSVHGDPGPDPPSGPLPP